MIAGNDSRSPGHVAAVGLLWESDEVYLRRASPPVLLGIILQNLGTVGNLREEYRTMIGE